MKKKEKKETILSVFYLTCLNVLNVSRSWFEVSYNILNISIRNVTKKKFFFFFLKLFFFFS